MLWVLVEMWWLIQDELGELPEFDAEGVCNNWPWPYGQ